MVINKKSVLILTLIVCALTTIWLGLRFYNSSNDHSHLTSSDKIIGSKMMQTHFYRLPIESIEDLTDKADLIIIGKVVSDGKTVRKDLSNSLLEKKNSVTSDMNLVSNTYPVTQVQIEIIEVLHGNTNTKQITYSQLGSADSHVGITKVKQNEELLLILHKDLDGTYASVDLENGIFLLEDKEIVAKNSTINNAYSTITSFSDDPVVEQYEKKDFAELVKDIYNAKKKGE